MRGAQVIERDGMVAVGQLEDQAVGAGAAYGLNRHACCVGFRQKRLKRCVADGDDIDALILGEEGAGVIERR